MKAHCLQHETFEDMAAVETWLLQKGFHISTTRLFESDELPVLHDIDWLIIMGGSMSVNDDALYPWIAAERKFVRECIDAGKTVIGICLGSQMIASSLGAKVYPNDCKEIGWFPMYKNKQAVSTLFAALPDELTVFHWHGETYDLPNQAVRIAGSDACLHQIFQYGKKTVGFQCHLETTAASLASLSTACQNEISESRALGGEKARFIQTSEEMKNLEPEYSRAMHDVLYAVLEAMLSDS
jgi:GMP synthase-like glutamine amidotransferase